MKLLTYLSMLALCFSVLMTSCSSNDDVKKAARESLGEVTPPPAGATPPPAANPATPEPPQNAEGVWHYTCPKGCAGGGGSAAPCGTCGETLAHNTAYHNNGTTPAAAPTITPPGAPAGLPTGAITPPPAATPPTTPEPAQNAAGVWHYSCPKGCAGGGGSAAPCGTCGETLAHNSGYH